MIRVQGCVEGVARQKDSAACGRWVVGGGGVKLGGAFSSLKGGGGGGVFGLLFNASVCAEQQKARLACTETGAGLKIFQCLIPVRN